MKQHHLEVAVQALTVSVSDIQEALKSNRFTVADIPMLIECARRLRLSTPQMEGQAETCDGLVRMLRRGTI